jgi:hypothetical protein
VTAGFDARSPVRLAVAGATNERVISGDGAPKRSMRPQRRRAVVHAANAMHDAVRPADWNWPRPSLCEKCLRREKQAGCEALRLSPPAWRTGFDVGGVSRSAQPGTR